MHVVVGLGNPGGRYAATRHNIGFMVADHLARQGNVSWAASPAEHCELVHIKLAAGEVLLVKPQTYMNRSGVAVVALQQRLGFAGEEILVVLDDFLLDFGRLRFRRKGSDGGHNGLASIIEQVGSQNISRLRVGIGQPPPEEDVIDYVLEPFAAAENVGRVVQWTCEAVEMYLSEGMDAAMNRFNA